MAHYHCGCSKEPSIFWVESRRGTMHSLCWEGLWGVCCTVGLTCHRSYQRWEYSGFFWRAAGRISQPHRKRECSNLHKVTGEFSMGHISAMTLCLNGFYLLLPQKFGCDGILGSLAREDHCGVCNGNGKSCKVIKGDFNHTRGAGNVCLFISNVKETSGFLIMWSTGKLKKLYFLKLYRSSKEL